MSLQQAGAGIRSLFAIRNTGFFARYRRYQNIFGLFGGVRRPAGHVGAAAKYRADGVMAGEVLRVFRQPAMSVSSPRGPLAYPFVNTA